MKMLRIRNTAVLAALLVSTACAARSGDPIKDAGRVGIGLADGIHQLQQGVAALSPKPIPAEKAREIQAALLKANEQLGRLPDFLETADAARQVGQLQPGDIENTIAVIGSISEQLNIVVKGLDVGETAAAMLKLAAQTRLTVADINTALAKARADLAAKE